MFIYAGTCSNFGFISIFQQKTGFDRKDTSITAPGETKIINKSCLLNMCSV